MGQKISKITKAAKGQDCTFRIHKVCNHNPETVVFCHAPSPVAGMATKSDDWWGAFGCSDCHKAMDEHLIPSLWQHWFHAIRRTMVVLIEKGIVILPPIDQKRPKYKDKVCTKYTGAKSPNAFKNRKRTSTKRTAVWMEAQKQMEGME